MRSRGISFEMAQSTLVFSAPTARSVIEMAQSTLAFSAQTARSVNSAAFALYYQRICRTQTG